MSSAGTRSVRFSVISQPDTSSEHTLSAATSPRSIAPASLLENSQLELIPDTTDMTGNDSLGVNPRQIYEYPPIHSHTGACEYHQPSLGFPAPVRSNEGHYVQPFHVSPFLSAITPQLSKFMKAALKSAWDIRFPPEETAFDSDPALHDASMSSIKIACDQFPEDILHIYGQDEDPITVADVYTALYRALLGEVTAEDELYAQRTASQRADIQEVTARRLGDPSAKMRQWKGQLRDLLGKDCVLRTIIVDHKTGRWRLEFIEADE